MKKQYEVGRKNGKNYKLVYDKMCNQLKVDSKRFRWFLTVETEYIGDFATKNEAIKEIT